MVKISGSSSFFGRSLGLSTLFDTKIVIFDKKIELKTNIFEKETEGGGEFHK